MARASSSISNAYPSPQGMPHLLSITSVAAAFLDVAGHITEEIVKLRNQDKKLRNALNDIAKPITSMDGFEFLLKTIARKLRGIGELSPLYTSNFKRPCERLTSLARKGQNALGGPRHKIEEAWYAQRADFIR